MNDIDGRLEDYARRWRSAHAARPEAHLRPDRPVRRWVPVTAVAASVVAILGLATVAVRDPRRPVAGATVVAWKPIPQGYYSKPPLPRDCGPGDVTMTAKLGGPRRNVAGDLTIRSTAPDRCALRDVTLQLLSDTGAPLDVDTVRDGDRAPRVLGAGRSGRIRIAWVEPYCGTKPRSLAVLARLAGSDPIRVPVEWPPDELPMCETDPRNPRPLFRYGDPQTGEEHQGRLPVDARVEAPASVRSGDVLRYRLVLENDGADPVPLDPCPVYVHTLRRRGEPAEGPTSRTSAPHTGRLHCEAAPAELDPGRAVAFEMELALGDLAEGEEYALYTIASMDVGTYGRQTIVTPVAVRGRADPPPARVCGVDAFALVEARAGTVGDEEGVGAGIGLDLYNVSAGPCDLSVLPRIAVVAPGGRHLADPVAQEIRKEVLRSGGARHANLSWKSHCGPRVYDYLLELTVPGQPGRALFRVDRADTPSCRDGAGPNSQLSWHPL